MIRTRRNAAIVLLVWIGSLAPGRADFTSDDVGTTSAAFLELGVGGRCEALGEACGAITDDANALYWNPAGMTLIPEKESSLTIMHSPYIDPTYFDFGGYAINAGKAGVFGVAVQYFSGGDIPQLDTNGIESGKLKPYDTAATVGYARTIVGYGVGITGKYIQSKLVNSANAMAVDIGVLSPGYFNDRFRLALVETNLGSRMKFDEKSYALPFNIRLGSRYLVTKAWNASFDMNFPINNDPYPALGSEYVWELGREWRVAGRVGYNGRNSGDADGLSGPTTGVGINLKNISVDYAFVPMGTIALTHRISISMRFPSKQPQK